MSRSRTPTLVLDDKRVAPRIQTRINATVTAGKRSVRFAVDNVSVSGARLVGPLVLVHGQRIAIALEIEATIAEVVGEVVRVDTPDLLMDQVAVRFVDLSDSARVVIRAHVARSLERAEEIGTDGDEITGPLPKLEAAET